MAMSTNLRERQTIFIARIAPSNGKSLVLTDATSKLSACLTYIEFLTEFARVFVDNVSHTEFRNLILKVEPITNGITIRTNNPERDLRIEVAHQFMQFLGYCITNRTKKLCRKIDNRLGDILTGESLFSKGGIKFVDGFTDLLFNKD